MKKVKYLFLAVVVAGAFSLTSCGGEKKEDAKDKKKNKDEESEFYDKDAQGNVIYFNEVQNLA